MRRRLLVVLLLFSFSSLAKSDVPARPRDVSADLKTIVVQDGVPGLIGGIVDGDGLVALGAAGVRRTGSPSLLTSNDKVHIGSCGKAMTATVIAMLVEDGTLSWPLILGEAFPELRDGMDAKWRGATVTHLLSHRSGAPKDLDADGLWGRLWESREPPAGQRMELVRGVLARAPEATPGRRFIYSNAGFAIAGAIAERATGTAWEDLIAERLFRPLAMDSAGFGAPGTPDLVDQPRGHKENGESVEPGREADNPPAIAPAGTVHCTVPDWAKFIQLHLSAAMGTPRLLNAESFHTLQTPPDNPKSDYALGWGIADRAWAGGKTLTHNGSNTMWYCVVWVAPAKGFAVMAACNQGGKRAEKTVDKAAWMLVQQHLGLND